ncbi:MAG: PDZ domain-containing protein [Candidatus Scalindua sp.]|jgi:serine protease Do|nr:PDZ domain-containing protein [Candidatus Scalindua sp.]MBT5303719.1 PDZ domain-containing protein [Candidatus Scalindua sp.]MBT6048155.1 PDZ domain-containing protein [Candidatus Scalindua sp.]MBT6231658.1 PDZ domain-containing protein [Candidatus Scalindua sp.]MBT7593131.1 PDZ domain-containing protein [Candidatus Scalindua sp.]
MYVKFSKLLRAKILICLVFLLLLSHGVCSGGEVEELRKDLLELEKIANPFVRIFQKVSRLVAPSVVSIVAEGAYGTSTNPHGEGIAPFSSPDGNNNKSPNSNKPSFGSGIVIKKTGYILTNFHVVSGFENGKITVTMYNGDKFDAAIIGKDPNTDLAILKIAGEDLREATLGDPKSVNVGDWVIAIGNPFGYSQTVSAGIVSAIGRTHITPFAKPFAYEDFIQTDAAINPGNSGGPLVNLRGEIIGVNSAIATRTGGFQGVGFAISMEIANEVISDLIEKGRVVRGYLGVGLQDINDSLAAYLNLSSKSDVLREFRLDSDKGAFISEVWQDTPASKGNIFPGDVIIEFGGRKIMNIDDLQKAIRVSEVDSDVAVTVVRNKKEELLTINIDEQPGNMSGRTYVTVRNLTAQTSLYVGLAVETLPSEDEEGHGVLVRHVVSGSPAERAGILPGDIILRVGSSDVKTASEFQSVLKTFVETKVTVSMFIKSKGYVTLKY